MLDFITIVYLVYTFIALYFLFLFIIIYLKNKNKIFEVPKLTREYSLSIVVPCYNEEESIGGTIEALLHSDYKNLRKIIVVDDRSTDNSYQIIKRYAAKYSRVMAVQTPKNTGKASGSKNYGSRFVKTDLIGFVDADSYPEKEAIRNMIGFFDNPDIAAVTSSVLVKERNNFIEKLQAIEYKIITFSRKLLGFVDAIYVTPGPLAIYRKNLFDKVHGFDERNMTEDIEITWNFVSHGYKVAMSTISRVYTVAPDKFKLWYKQRIRWNVGGIQTINKYKNNFMKAGMLGVFILPFFVMSWVIGVIGILFLAYRIISQAIIWFLSISYSAQAQTAVLTLRDINFTPTILFFFGMALLVLGTAFTLVALSYTKEKGFKKQGIFSFFVYSFVYLLAYPVILVNSAFKYITKTHKW